MSPSPQVIRLEAERTAEIVALAAGRLRAGELVGIPTETVYGLAADATDGEAVARIFDAKGRPRFNPLICHVDGPEMAADYGVFDARAERLIDAFWPGPLTLVVPLRPGAAAHPLVTAGLDSIAIRWPRGIAGEIVTALGRPLAAPSANRSGRISATRAGHVVDQLGDRVSLVIDAGPCPVGVESTIVSLLEDAPRLLRPGGVAAEDIEAHLGRPLLRKAPGATIQAPGMLASHYAPRVPVRLEARNVEPGEALLAFGPAPLPGQEKASATLNLSASGDLVEAAARLFDGLAELDSVDPVAIAVMPIPQHGLGEAINDRLMRAAAPRPEREI
ncbi:translation factor SUA5 [Faunimonas pinastri]|uniref:Threonylcarbamoyl-AMP synthase n=1 Tax=Faunimonas pinastri TaxID=1855383 RepID=A0A1H8ZY05_9HYPH|nr:L-threonylcarbamoyladenylate synthase [Faunimonas pinastri]SEP69133.1 translation factor SUA5 [Faunimonas pinastri]